MEEKKRTDIQIPDQLLTAISHRDCVFFIGAGFSIDAGLPGGNKIAQKLLDILRRNGYSNGIQPLYKIAQDFENSRRRPELTNTICDIISKAQEQADRHPFELLTKIKPQPIDIITTNWDKLIEEAYGRRNITVILDDKSLPQHKSSIANLLKIHGDLDNLMGATITNNDYANFKDKHEGFYQKLCTLFREKTILFLGYSTEDWDSLEIILKIKEELKNNTNPRYGVTPDDRLEVSQRFKNLDITHIKATARNFLSVLAKQLEGEEGESGKLYEEHPKFPNPTLPEVVEKNPFVVFRAEDMSDKLWQSDLFREPMMYNIFSNTISPGNVFIEGHRGSGKSMILLYLSYPIQRLLGIEPEFVGIYIKLDLPLFATTRRRGENRDEWVDYFLSYFNLIVAEVLIKTLDESISKQWVKTENVEKLLGKLKRLFPISGDENVETLIDLADLLQEKRSDFAGPPPRPFIRVNSDLIKALIERIRRYVPVWEKKPFYILLDEYERLDEDQQKVVNLLLASRGPTYREKICFKIATKSFMTALEDIDGNQIESGDDFTPVCLDRFDLDEERKHGFYRKFIEDLANRRLQTIWDYKISISDLLPISASSEGDYSGFENIVTLSSFIPRDFLELCKDMVFYAYPNLLIGPKREKLDPISPNLQNTVIKIHADNLFENLNRIMDEEERPLPRTRSENARRLIESWGKIFKRILTGSKRKEKRTVSEFQIRDASKLNSRVLNALSDCTKTRTLRVPLTKRNPQIKRNIPSDRYELHRLLCARFGLSLARRWPKEVDAEWLNELIDSEDPAKAIDELTKYFIKEENSPPKQPALFDYGEKT